MIFLNELDENWIVDRFRREWYELNGHYSTTNIKERIIKEYLTNQLNIYIKYV